jgi:hypothetical protein
MVPNGCRGVPPAERLAADSDVVSGTCRAADGARRPGRVLGWQWPGTFVGVGS